MRVWLGLSVIMITLAACTSSDDGKTTPVSTTVETPLPRVRFEPAFTGLPNDNMMWKCDPVFVDVNSDGHIDLAAHPRLGDGSRIFLGDSKGTWSESSKQLLTGERSCGGGMAFGDINNDGRLDLAVADHCRGVCVYIGSGTGNWLLAARGIRPDKLEVEDDDEIEMQLGVEDLDIGDVNGDGFLDIVTGSSDEGGINLYLGDGTGLNWEHQLNELPRKGWANRVRLADMNVDGHLDVVASYDLGPRVWHGDGTGHWKLESHGLPAPPVRGIFRGLDVGDVNGDGRPDIAVANWIDGPEVFIQQEGGTWYEADDVLPGMTGGATGVALGDLDQDGNLDIVAAGRMDRQAAGIVRGVFVMLGDGKGGWAFQANTGIPETGLGGLDGLGLGDFDGDGVLDVALGSGLAVESSSKGLQEPVVEPKLLVWRTIPTNSRTANAPAD